MELLYTAINSTNVHSLSKSKIIRFRHYETLLLNALLIALVFFLIFKNNQLSQKIITSQTMETMMEQIFQQKFSHIFKEIQQMKRIIVDQNKKVISKQNQNKNIMLTISKELGLPFYQEDKQQEEESLEKTYQNNLQSKYYQIIQFEENSSIQSNKYQEKNQESQEKKYHEEIQESQSNNQEELREIDEEEDQQQQGQEQAGQTCKYLDYLMQKDIEQEPLHDQNDNQVKSEVNNLKSSWKKLNFSRFHELNHSISYLEENYETEMHFLGNVILIIGFIYGLFMLISFVNKKSKFDFNLSIMRVIKNKNSENKRRIYK